MTANFKQNAVTPTTGTLVISVLNYFGSDSYLSKVSYTLDGSNTTVTGNWYEPDQFLSKSLSTGSHSISIVSSGTTVVGASGYRVYFDPSTFSISEGQTTNVNLIVTTN